MKHDPGPCTDLGTTKKLSIEILGMLLIPLRLILYYSTSASCLSKLLKAFSHFSTILSYVPCMFDQEMK